MEDHQLQELCLNYAHNTENLLLKSIDCRTNGRNKDILVSAVIFLLNYLFFENQMIIKKSSMKANQMFTFIHFLLATT